MLKVEDFTAVIKGLADISWQMLRFGPILSTKITLSSLSCLPNGLAAAGAESVKQGVDNEDAQGIARITADLVKMGLLWLVHDIVVHLCQEGRADAVAAVTVGLLQLGEMDVIIQINNSLIASGHGADAVKITGGLVANGYTDLTKLASQSVEPGREDESTVDMLKRKGQEAIETVSGSQQKAGADQKRHQEEQKEEPSTSYSGHDDIEEILERDSQPKSEQEPGVIGGAINRGQELAGSAVETVRTNFLSSDAQA